MADVIDLERRRAQREGRAPMTPPDTACVDAGTDGTVKLTVRRGDEDLIEHTMDATGAEKLASALLEAARRARANLSAATQRAWDGRVIAFVADERGNMVPPFASWFGRVVGRVPGTLAVRVVFPAGRTPACEVVFYQGQATHGTPAGTVASTCALRLTHNALHDVNLYLAGGYDLQPTGGGQ